MCSTSRVFDPLVQRLPVLGVAYSGAIPTEDEVTRADAAFHAATAHLYEPTLEPLFRAYTRLVVEPWLDALPRLTNGREALDVGCGTGAMTIQLAERGYHVRGIDHSREMLGVAERHIAERRLESRIQLRAGDVRDLPFAAETFDVVAVQGVLHHLDDMRPCLAEIARVLKPGGVFRAAEPCEGSTAAIRLLESLGRAKARVRSRRRMGPPAWPAPPSAPIPDHYEGPISTAVLGSILDELGLSHEVTYWSRFPGLHRVRPLRLQELIIAALSRPWARRSGNLVIVEGRKT